MSLEGYPGASSVVNSEADIFTGDDRRPINNIGRINDDIWCIDTRCVYAARTSGEEVVSQALKLSLLSQPPDCLVTGAKPDGLALPHRRPGMSGMPLGGASEVRKSARDHPGPW